MARVQPESVMKPLIYVAGPYTRPDPVTNTRAAIFAADALVAAGAAVVVPHLTMLWHLVSPQPLEEWYRRDIDVLDHCDAMVRLPGDSTGADAEAVYASGIGIPVFYSVEECVEADFGGIA